MSSDEHLNYAQENLREWKAKGEEYVAQFREKHCGVGVTVEPAEAESGEMFK